MTILIRLNDKVETFYYTNFTLMLVQKNTFKHGYNAVKGFF